MIAVRTEIPSSFFLLEMIKVIFIPKLTKRITKNHTNPHRISHSVGFLVSTSGDGSKVNFLKLLLGSNSPVLDQS
jgi:hypothetical protein